MDQWALFVNYRRNPKTQELCRKNQQSRQNQIPHTGGAKSLARRRAEMKAKGKAVNRGQMWMETHKRKDGSYVSDEARVIGRKLKKFEVQDQNILPKFHQMMHLV
ncbi:uncharacterized protein LOC132068773 [Lycium ferocissimum]|uniref:uncharacterized protein LOC132068773 n=1 Tax=Lycium ferocissimum TaxID=112874 RepID=UPI002814F4F5|nr:uncharacterized protein LOC132068773 [Lycium ferocissimum]